MGNLLEQAINCDDGDRAPKHTQDVLAACARAAPAHA
jgi:hypothetical protein